MMAVETDQKVELEAMIKDLEEENRFVQDYNSSYDSRCLYSRYAIMIIHTFIHLII